MCILFVAIEQHEQYPLIIAANRDEFVVRPTLPSHFWGASQQILSGIDQQAGGWLANICKVRQSIMSLSCNIHNLITRAITYFLALGTN